MKINIIFHSLFGHVYRLAEAVAEGARQEGAQVGLFQVAETLSDDILTKMNAIEAKKVFAHIPTATVDTLTEADALIFGTPTRFGMMSAQMRAFWDMTGGLWVQKALVGKVGSVFTSTGTQHGGQEATLLSFHTTLLHHGMIIVGVPYSIDELMIVHEVSGGSPYGSTTIAGPDNSRLPSENELIIARFQGKHVAGITKHLVK
ncbi:MAG: NAD(P)H:quinone oxidoreductase [Thermodesulfobacteriota bacterium]|nr:NAD(P)H:quinone oxidoreductase [Thermodesulfobacteriota bacterium]